VQQIDQGAEFYFSAAFAFVFLPAVQSPLTFTPFRIITSHPVVLLFLCPPFRPAGDINVSQSLVSHTRRPGSSASGAAQKTVRRYLPHFLLLCIVPCVFASTLRAILITTQVHSNV
jgi:hypothetical protein